MIDAGDCEPRLAEAPARPSNANNPAGEERLLRFVDILRTEQVRASITNAKNRRTGLRRWRGPAVLLALVVVTLGAASLLQPSSAPAPHPNARPDSAFAAAFFHSVPEPVYRDPRDLPKRIVQSQPPESMADGDAPTDRPVHPAPHPVPKALSPGNPSSAPVLAERHVVASPDTTQATAPTAITTAQPKPIELLASRSEADTLAGRPAAKTAAELSEYAEAAKPVLRIYYPYGSSRAEANARILSARIDPDLASFDFQAQADLPNGAVVKFSEEKNHALARILGKSLGGSGYRWKIENASGSAKSHRNLIEVWLPG